ncbi:hypothetical protein Aca07nite_19140 [Actinoplanes capillaceus]|uniref:Uncharacterized protein n=1 Tax=Actinoplanes campanulatus TaxID=113559 RepID=A0ABQ3WC82_9ACTN|nr:hypothetical protein Aca07nite_19140 [Actinoplanes capillaceus]
MRDEDVQQTVLLGLDEPGRLPGDVRDGGGAAGPDGDHFSTHPPTLEVEIEHQEHRGRAEQPAHAPGDGQGGGRQDHVTEYTIG